MSFKGDIECVNWCKETDSDGEVISETFIHSDKEWQE